MNRDIKLAVVAAFAAIASVSAAQADAKKTWHAKLDYIEACSCNLFCQCYFQTHPEGEMFCEFNMGVRVREGHVGDVKLDGLKFWLSGDLGGDFTKGMKSAVLTFDTATTKEQRDAIAFVVTKLYPAKFEKFNTDVAPVTWERTGPNGYAKLGDKAEIKLEGVVAPDGKPAILHNVKYWGADRNEGFELAYGTHFYKGFGHDYSHKRRNGFFITAESSGTLP